MKGKALALVVAILIAGSAFALESGPSNPVGFFTNSLDHTLGGTQFYLISFPTIPTDSSLSNTLGAQVPGTTRAGTSTNILWYNNYTGGFVSAYRNSTTLPTWDTSGGMRNCLESRKGYYILLRSTAPASVINLVVAGNVRTNNWNMDSIVSGFNLVGSVFAAPVALTGANLVSGTSRLIGGARAGTADQVMRLNPTTGGFDGMYLTTTNTWALSAGTAFSQFDPGYGYYIFRRTGGGRVNFLWPDYPVPASTSSSDSYTATPIRGTKSAVTPVTFDNAPRSKTVTVAPTSDVSPVAPTHSDAAAPVKAKSAPSSTSKSK